MLSYKIKHLFSCVIASLSVFGFMSISERVHAASDDGSSNYWQPGGKTTAYNILGNGVLNAAYQEALECPELENAVLGSRSIQSGATSCRYYCASGYSHGLKDGGTEFELTGADSASLLNDYDRGSGQYCTLSSVVCTSSDPTISSGKAVSTVVTENGIEVRKMYCEWTCANGYHKNNSSTFNGTTLEQSGTISPESSCDAKSYTLTLDCGEGGYFVGSTSQRTRDITVVYKQQVTIPADAKCTKPSAEFLGYDKEFNAK